MRRWKEGTRERIACQRPVELDIIEGVEPGIGGGRSAVRGKAPFDSSGWVIVGDCRRVLVAVVFGNVT